MIPVSGDVAALLRNLKISVGAGLERLDASGNVVEDLSDVLDGGEIEWHGNSTVHRTCSLRITKALEWENARLRVFRTVRGPGTAYQDVVRSDLPVLFWRSDEESLSAAPGSGLPTRSTALPVPVGSTGWAVECWVASAVPLAAAVRLWCLTEPGGVQVGTDIQQLVDVAVVSVGDVRVDRVGDASTSLQGPRRHVVLTGGPASWDCYVDGRPVLSGVPSNLPTVFDHLDVGTGLVATPGRLWGGMVDEVAVYDRQLTYAEVAAHSAAGAGGQEARFDRGVFRVQQQPERNLGRSPAVFEVSGLDLLADLDVPVGDSYVAAAGSGFVTAVRAAFTASGVTAPLLIDNAAAGKTLPAGFGVWCLASTGQATWLRIVNDLLAAVGYRGVNCDESGAYRSEPYQTPVSRPAEWLFDLTDPSTDIVEHTTRTVTGGQVWRVPNRWRFVMNRDTPPPTVGDGIYDVSIPDGQPARAAEVQFLDVADHASLVSEGDRVVQDARQVKTTIVFDGGPLPILGHWDVVQLNDPAAGLLKGQVASWVEPLSKSRARITMEVV